MYDVDVGVCGVGCDCDDCAVAGIWRGRGWTVYCGLGGRMW